MGNETKVIAHEGTDMDTSIFYNADMEKDYVVLYPLGTHCNS